ncbi:hypothetical protein FSP39_004293 [Pinctada imbricata]|uniref:Reverse transcriptase domain-containing protein n=1 Tax=Pinctada imbricata TaxID=66713 RepID=A0AA89C233_PINIB|nr:hypothetical protein FSP39_004293 [Pinctada imbricata]
MDNPLTSPITQRSRRTYKCGVKQPPHYSLYCLTLKIERSIGSEIYVVLTDENDTVSSVLLDTTLSTKINNTTQIDMFTTDSLKIQINATLHPNTSSWIIFREIILEGNYCLNDVTQCDSLFVRDFGNVAKELAVDLDVCQWSVQVEEGHVIEIEIYDDMSENSNNETYWQIYSAQDELISKSLGGRLTLPFNFVTVRYFKNVEEKVNINLTWRKEYKSYKSWSCSDLCSALSFLLDNIYVRFGENLYKQVVGIPMGTNCAPLVADLFLYTYEKEFIQNLQKHRKHDDVKCFTGTSRYLDDILTIDNPVFEKYKDVIYPQELTLNKANFTDTETPFLDLNIKIVNGEIHTSVYDKRDDFGFNIVNFPWLDADVPRLPSYGIYISQLIRLRNKASKDKESEEVLYVNESSSVPLDRKYGIDDQYSEALPNEENPYSNASDTEEQGEPADMSQTVMEYNEEYDHLAFDGTKKNVGQKSSVDSETDNSYGTLHGNRVGEDQQDVYDLAESSNMKKMDITGAEYATSSKVRGIRNGGDEYSTPDKVRGIRDGGDEYSTPDKVRGIRDGGDEYSTPDKVRGIRDGGDEYSTPEKVRGISNGGFVRDNADNTRLYSTDDVTDNTYDHAT